MSLGGVTSSVMMDVEHSIVGAVGSGGSRLTAAALTTRPRIPHTIGVES